ncbi:hypothetical protein RUND412_010263 [Rhizina undulata]
MENYNRKHDDVTKDINELKQDITTLKSDTSQIEAKITLAVDLTYLLIQDTVGNKKPIEELVKHIKDYGEKGEMRVNK